MKKVLFVCQRNNGRSQMAKGIYNKLSKSNDADSAGVDVDKHGQLLKDRAQEPTSDVSKVITAMDEMGVDVTEFPRKQLDVDMLQNYEKVIVIMKRALVPKSLRGNPKVEIWDIEDPKAKDIEGLREIRDQIKANIIKML